MNRLPERTVAEILVDNSIAITVEIEQLAYLEGFFNAIRGNANCSYSFKRLASLGEYLTQGFNQTIFKLAIITTKIESPV